MTKTDWTPDGQPSDEADPLSATGMFLSSFGKEAEQPQKPAEPSFTAPVAPPAAWQPEPGFAPSRQAPPAASQGGPGEFTKLFQASQAAAATTPPADRTPVPSFEPRPVPAPAGASAPGEFTRIFVKAAETNLPDRAPAPPRLIPDLPPAPAPAPGAPRMKGFSSGASDSASVEGGFTQFFQPRPAGAAPPPAPVSAPPAPPYTPPAPAPVAAPAEFKWPAPSDFGASKTPVESPTGSSSATSLFASLAAAETGPEPVKATPTEPLNSYTPKPTPSYSPSATSSFSSAPLPSYTPAPPAAPSAPEAGSVTRLIQRLSEGTKAPPLVEPSAAAAAPPPPPVDSGPGEFTRMISTSTMRASASPPAAPAAPAPAAGAAPAFVPPPIPKPAIAMPPMPAAPPPPAMAAPKFEPPKAPAVPKPAPPAVAAPAGKFQEMVPILLVVNTFLLLVLIVLVIFELKGK